MIVPPPTQRMEIELIEIRDFLARTAPFHALPEGVLGSIAPAICIRYLRRGSAFPPADAEQSFLYVVRSGAVELREADGELAEKLSEGGLYSGACHLLDASAGMTGRVVEDSLLYLLPCDVLRQLCATFEVCSRFFSESLHQRIQLALCNSREEQDHGLAALTVPVGQLLRCGPVCVPPTTSIREAAGVMAQHQVSSVLVVQGETLIGLVTDRDLRNRCVAAGLSFELPVEQIMTRELHTASSDTLVIEALNRMAGLRVNHLPVVDAGRPVGMLSVGDLARHQSANAAFLTVDIRKAETVEQLAAIAARLPQLQVLLPNARQIGLAVSSIADGLTQRLLSLAEARLGPPPVPYAWLTGGSQARREQTAHSDQDNALLLSDDFRPEHDAYFEQLARFVCDGLDACGFVHCPGNSMAMNPQWRQPLRTWRRYFTAWIGQPDPMALMLAAIYFDLRVVAGDATLFAALHSEVIRKSRGNDIFIAHLAASSLRHRPPLGFFRTFVLIRDGEHDATLDLKHHGIVPITDIARILALSAGIGAIHTVERLQAACGAGVLVRETGENLEDALEYLNHLRTRHQAGQIRRGEPIDNFVAPESLSKLEREHLKDAFKIIKTMQDTFQNRYHTDRLG